MKSNSRRSFLKQTAMAGTALTANRWFKGNVFAQSASTTARIYVDPAQKIATLERKVFGSFIEHLGRAVYGGIYEPGSRLADANGFRKDVLEEIKRMGVPIIRYPGGNFVSGYNWLDGVGPKDKRPVVLDKAWNTIETNQFGTNEFLEWCRAVGSEPLLGLNLGTGTPEMAAALVEYCNQEKGTKWSELRREHGVEKPHNIKYWCIGNEMDGWWQIGHMPAREYGLKARDCANQMRMIDPSLQLIACGSSSPGMQTYLEWDRQVLEECYDMVDGISLHCYYRNDDQETGAGGDTAKFLSFNLEMENQINEIAGVCDYVKARNRSSKKLWLSFDEWNVWYRARNGDGKRQQAPHLLEEVYNLEDALLVGGFCNSLMRHAERVRIACLAQLVNVIAPITTNADGFFRHTIYYPYAWTLQCARGEVLDLAVESPTYNVQGKGAVPYLDVSGTMDGKNVTLFVLNRDLNKARDVEVIWREAAPDKVGFSQVLTGRDLKAFNSFENPNKVAPQPFEAPKTGSKTKFQVPAHSYTVIQWSS
ncbi:MAG: alpha-N-arabinofuranosidase [Sedimentisphaerales bacterium]|nr:alpha-N-arabinofuranosidase [Sedimentisphaerales bacterium]